MLRVSDLWVSIHFHIQYQVFRNQTNSISICDYLSRQPSPRARPGRSASHFSLSSPVTFKAEGERLICLSDQRSARYLMMPELLLLPLPHGAETDA